ncbi:Transcription factor pbcR-like protein [Cladobotryum mycophilum]|uniref:Transcription factor pbcR-like protein n=1 Tax=Cladobotryum mycophilum TaxID=491253 RepID=A0ABR0SFI1_9HYPO
MSLRRPNLIRWTPFMAESMEILEKSPEAAPTDKYFCHLVWTHRLAEEVGAQFSLDDTSSAVNISDARTQYALRALERDLDKYVASVPKNLMQPTLQLSFNVVNLYMHEMALHSDTAEQWRPPFNTEALKDSLVGSEPLSAAHINALSACLTAIDGVFDTFLSMDVLSIRCLPVFNFMRVAYGVVILIKMYFSASSPGSEMGKVINKNNMRVEYYLEALLEKFRATAADNKCRPAAKFLVVLAMMRSWFFKQGKGEGKESTPARHSATPDEGSASNQIRTQTQQPQPQQQSQPHQLQPNTPLQLLSEVATGRDSNNPRHIFNSLAGTGRQPHQPFFHDSVSTDTASGSTPSNHPSLAHLQGPSPTSASGSTSGAADFDSVLAPTFSSWIGTQTMPTDLDMTGMLNLDFEGLGFPLLKLKTCMRIVLELS